MIAFLPERAIVLSVGGFSLHWYATLYILAFALAWALLPRLQRYRELSLTREQWLEILTWGIGGVVIGGRLGYVLLYEPTFFLNHPAEVFSLSSGGMSAHGGFVGVAIALWFASRQLKVDYWRLLDVVVVPAALGLALGRVGNWINQELFLSAAAHQLVIVKNIVVALVGFYALRRWTHPGLVVALFLITYALLRFGTEYLRVQEFTGIAGLTRGQLLTIPLLVIGLWIGNNIRQILRR